MPATEGSALGVRGRGRIARLSKTQRDAGRRDVHLLLKEMENHHARKPSPTVD
jgi:hypothetical protein